MYFKFQLLVGVYFRYFEGLCFKLLRGPGVLRPRKGKNRVNVVSDKGDWQQPDAFYRIKIFFPSQRYRIIEYWNTVNDSIAVCVQTSITISQK